MQLEELRLRADQAKELKDDPAFQAAVLALRKQWHAEQMVASDEKEIVRLARAMQTLEAIPQQLQVHMNDYQMAKARSK